MALPKVKQLITKYVVASSCMMGMLAKIIKSMSVAISVSILNWERPADVQEEEGGHAK